ncbi:MAG: Hsp20/alpha crystallin family protein [Planctomycetes bacterium]|nr:Hsp20/alpha crystallin family protein [Planctomycetota bacterium]MBI3833609.1 Hsp20/alpha crystallin family protein [Planctomycetota bacterium]
MLLQRMNQTFPFHQLRQEVGRLFEDYLGGVDGGTFSGTRGSPAINLWEDGDTLFAEAEVPGMNMQDLEVSVIGDELSIKGQRKECCTKTEGATYHRQERGCGEFSRLITLPCAVRTDRVQAVLKDGVLTVTMPKAEEAKPRRIEVKAE